ncbi:TPA: YdcF family protein, partial [Shigella flexneri]|nr:YdcF family protein [Shigella flexneri]HCR6972410.1 YdcF family protein [Shigella flexneri]HCR8307012.1 YdcF family protein [Shigella flexneri]HCR8640073.1 YdcF family protein [Shigella flexneri]HCS2642005.1 YdcF family protein [Shigella flexneri]
LTGELPRLHDDSDGYGPRGRDFIVHVDFPAEVIHAWQTLKHDAVLIEAMESRSLR